MLKQGSLACPFLALESEEIKNGAQKEREGKKKAVGGGTLFFFSSKKGTPHYGLLFSFFLYQFSWTQLSDAACFRLCSRRELLQQGQGRDERYGKL